MEVTLQGVTVILILAAFAGLGWLVHRERQRRAMLHRRYLRRGRQLSRSLRMARLGEELAGLGYWQFDPAQQKQTWSAGLFKLFGLDQPVELCPGDIEMLLPDGGEAFSNQLIENSAKRGVFEFDFGATRIDGQKRTFRLHARNHFTRTGSLRQCIGVVKDITEQMLKETQLRKAEEEASRKAQAAIRVAHTDALTGLANRRAVMGWIDREIGRCKCGDCEMSILMFDIDHFKAVNDTYGHQAGDEVLKQIAAITCREARANDLVGRMGGEEFVIGMRDAGPMVVRGIAERMRRAIAKGSGAGGVPPVTVSMGYAAWRTDDTSLSLFARADAALYAAKEEGRNRVKRAA